MLDNFESNTLTLDCAKFIQKLEKLGHVDLAAKIQVLNQKRLKSRVMVEIESIRSQLRYKQKGNLSADKLKLKNDLKFAAGKYDYIRLGIYKQNWRQIRSKKKKAKENLKETDKSNVVLEVDRKDTYAKSYMLIESYNCFMSQLYSETIKKRLDIASDVWANTYGFIIMEGMMKSNKFHEDVCVFYSKKCEQTMNDINDLVESLSTQSDFQAKVSDRLVDAENDFQLGEDKLVKQKKKTRVKRQTYLKIVQEIMGLKKTLVKAKCRLDLEKADVKTIRVENEKHFQENEKKLQHQTSLNEDKKDDLQLVVDQVSQLKIHLGKNRYREEQLDKESTEVELAQETVKKETEEINNNILTGQEEEKKQQNEVNKSIIKLSQADQKLKDWLANIDSRLINEENNRKRKIRNCKEKLKKELEDGEFFKNKLTKRMEMAKAKVDQLDEKKSSLNSQLIEWKVKLDSLKSDRERRIREITVETQVIQDRNFEIRKINLEIKNENEKRQDMNNKGLLEINRLRKLINEAKLNYMVEEKSFNLDKKRNDLQIMQEKTNFLLNAQTESTAELTEIRKKLMSRNQILSGLKGQSEKLKNDINNMISIRQELILKRKNLFAETNIRLKHFNIEHDKLCWLVHENSEKTREVKLENQKLVFWCNQIVRKINRAQREMLGK